MSKELVSKHLGWRFYLRQKSKICSFLLQSSMTSAMRRTLLSRDFTRLMGRVFWLMPARTSAYAAWWLIIRVLSVKRSCAD